MSAEESCLSARAELPFGGSLVLHRSAFSSSRKVRARGVRGHSSGRNLRRGRFRPINTPGLLACCYKTAPGRSNWPNRDPIGEKGGRNLYVFAFNAPVNGFDPDGRFTLIDVLVFNTIQARLILQLPMLAKPPVRTDKPTGRVDFLGLKKWCGTCETYGAAIKIGLQFLECYLTTPCDSQCKYEYVHVKAWFGSVSASPLPANCTQFRTCFETPDEQDYTAFNGAARFVTITVSPGVGKTGGKIVLGDAVSEGVDDTSGIDVSASFGAGKSSVRSHYRHLCK
jgi:hypothetical protein